MDATDRAKLKQAHKLIEEVLAVLHEQVGTVVCECCGKVRSRSTDEYVWHEMLSAAALRVEKVRAAAKNVEAARSA